MKQHTPNYPMVSRQTTRPEQPPQNHMDMHHTRFQIHVCGRRFYAGQIKTRDVLEVLEPRTVEEILHRTDANQYQKLMLKKVVRLDRTWEEMMEVAEQGQRKKNECLVAYICRLTTYVAFLVVYWASPTRKR
ncbi:uncharacterized protein BO80DRAFT_439332 [Aspergillus ibericus CBS 121593]|uniref:Uncharacterized protein n=1 Tax=Aspergillus ibericus CBS 121593 TaxID=1448316 RepID=A0A395GJE0_9EURO|nr:hypothetical protein BO80DRAFT_439332 [Aspergillus ibericus CBS 121593]RAK95484.1 hypothetical protein BO80DRAFT_439332 [Aspergillus ibericus CBS 121593]